MALRAAAIACIREIGVDTGGSNVQFAVNPRDDRAASGVSGLDKNFLRRVSGRHGSDKIAAARKTSKHAASMVSTRLWIAYGRTVPGATYSLPPWRWNRKQRGSSGTGTPTRDGHGNRMLVATGVFRADRSQGTGPCSIG